MSGREGEVDDVLAELRQRMSSLSGARGAGDERRELLARVEAGAATAARAATRLPPVMTDRRGLFARVETAVKRLARRATNWFTWEQINFNAATADALRAAHDLLKDQHKRETELRERVAQLETELEEMRRQRRSD